MVGLSQEPRVMFQKPGGEAVVVVVVVSVACANSGHTQDSAISVVALFL